MLYVLALVLSIGVAIVIDVISYRRMPVAQKYGFYPNLPLWGIGLLTGLCINFLGMLRNVLGANLQVLANVPESPWYHFYQLSLLAVPTILLALTILSVARICHRE